MFDDRVLYPVRIGRTRAAIGFEVVDADFPAGDLRTADDEPVLLAGQCEGGLWIGGVDGENAGTERKKRERGEVSHGRDVPERRCKNNAIPRATASCRLPHAAAQPHGRFQFLLRLGGAAVAARVAWTAGRGRAGAL